MGSAYPDMWSEPNYSIEIHLNALFWDDDFSAFAINSDMDTRLLAPPKQEFNTQIIYSHEMAAVQFDSLDSPQPPLFYPEFNLQPHVHAVDLSEKGYRHSVSDGSYDSCSISRSNSVDLYRFTTSTASLQRIQTPISPVSAFSVTASSSTPFISVSPSSSLISVSPSSSLVSVHVSPSASLVSASNTPFPASNSKSEHQAAARRHRKKFSPELKKATHMTRLEGACLRCWRNRKRCIKVDDACCKYCNTLLDQIPNTPCFRSRLSSSELFRKGPTDEFCWTRRRWLQTSFNDSKVWRSPHRRLFVAQGSMGLRLELLVKQYEPLPEDKDTYTWVDHSNGVSRPRELKMPRYAVADIGGALEEINRYIGTHMQSYIEKKIGPHEIIPWSTFEMAMKLSKTEGSSLLRGALRLWTACRIIEDPWEIVGDDRLGMDSSNDPSSPYYGKVPVTPVMDFQIDNITIHKILLPLRKQILQDLQRKVLDNRRKDFLEIFLTIYTLLHNIELTIAHDRRFAQRYEIPSRFSHYELIDNIFLGANIMLTHFHYVTKGYAAFAVDWKKNMTGSEKAKEDQARARYMDTISTAARHQESSLKMLKERDQYESPMFWCSQLFYGDWKPVVSPCA